MKNKLIAAAFVHFLLPQSHADTLKCRTEWGLPTSVSIEQSFLGLGGLQVKADCLDKRESHCVDANVLADVLDFSQPGRVSMSGTYQADMRYEHKPLSLTSMEWHLKDESLDLYLLMTDYTRQGWKEVHRTLLSDCIFLN